MSEGTLNCCPLYREHASKLFTIKTSQEIIEKEKAVEVIYKMGG
jgi:hypothetical protein